MKRNRFKKFVNQRKAEAEYALNKSQQELEEIKNLQPEVTQLVAAHQRLQRRNRFQERMKLALRGEA